MEAMHRGRRLRNGATVRRMIRETKLSVDDFMYPLFVVEGEGIKKEISSMPGNYHFSIDCLLEELAAVSKAGIPGVIFFGIPDHKDPAGSGAYDENGIVQRALRAAKAAFPDLLLCADVCLCEYTNHGHCGLIHEGKILNDPTVDLLIRTSLSYAAAGADIIAPSDMMDGRIGAIRRAMDEGGFQDRIVMAYSAKYSSSFYGPFREAAHSAPSFGDRKTYQMDVGNFKEALREIEADIAEGADIVMVKPALAYLDVIREVSQRYDLPIAAYNVSGEYAMIKAAALQGWLDEKGAALEMLTAIKRAGAKIIITYYAKQAAEWLREDARNGG